MNVFDAEGPAQTLQAALAVAAQSKERVTFEDRRGICQSLSYATLRSRARRSASVWKMRGVRPGQRVAIVLPTSPKFYDAFFGVLELGAIPTPLYPPTRLGRLEGWITGTHEQFRALKVAWIVTDALLQKVVGYASIGVHSLVDTLNIDIVPDDEELGEIDHQSCADDVALIQLSSGTTGTPKPIFLTHRQLLANIDAFCAALAPAQPSNRRHSCVSWLPLYHDMGLVGCMLAAVREAAHLTLLPPEIFVAQPRRWLAAIAREQASVSAAPHFAYALCHERLHDDDLQGLDLSCWRVALNGAEPIVPDVMVQFAERLARLCGVPETAMTPVYGLAEAGLAVTFSPVDRPFLVQSFDREALELRGVAKVSDCDDVVALPSVGQALVGYAVRVLDPQGREVTAEVGDVEFKGPSTLGWAPTGDRGFLFNHALYIWGRAKDVIIVRGRNVAPAAIEAEVGGLAEVRSGCVVATSDPAAEAGGEQLSVFYERAAGSNVEDSVVHPAIARCLSERFGLVATRIVPLPPGTLPRTSSGKLKRRLTIVQYRSKTLCPPAKSSWWSVGRQLLSARIKLGLSRLGRRFLGSAR